MDEETGASRSEGDGLDDALEGYLNWAEEQGLNLDTLDLPKTRDADLPGAGTQLGDFELVRALGGGGMGVVFEARQRSVPGRRVAVKLLRSRLATDQAEARFRREIAAIGRLDHPGIVPIVSASVEGGSPYYAMKFVEGVSASRLLARLREASAIPTDTHGTRALAERNAPPERDGRGSSAVLGDDPESAWEHSYFRWVATLGMHLAEALQHSSECGIVHRDVKPGNVMVTPRGRPVLIDFGLATGGADESLTEATNILGTLPYSAPEQLRGEEVDSRADVYSLGATLYELLSLTRPFDATNRSALIRQIELENPPTLPATVPVDLRTIVSCALEKARNRRYATPGRMAHDLREFLAGRPILARPASVAARLARLAKRYPKSFTAAAAVLVLLAGFRAVAHARAWHLVARAREGLDATAELHAELDARLREYAHVAATDGFQLLEPDPIALGDLRRAIDALRDELEGKFSDVERLSDRALEFVAGYGPARRLRARLYTLWMERALRDAGDVFQRTPYEQLEQKLGTVLRDSPLLSPLGRVHLECPVGGAHVEIWKGGARIYEGAPPLDLRDLEEGTYEARVRAEGYANTVLPFLVRRDASYDAGCTLPPRGLEIDMIPEGEVIPEFVFVPAGWTLVEDDPPRWEWIEGYQIHRREVTNADWLELLKTTAEIPDRDQIERGEGGRFRPRETDGTLHVQYDEESGLWGLWNDDLARPEWPVRGLGYDELGSFVNAYPWIAHEAPPGWYYSFPYRQEWLRAARGADAREYPWGSGFEDGWCAWYRSTERRGNEPFPSPVESFPRDRSPFGVLDLAGSIAEITLSAQGVVPGERAVCGGSYQTSERGGLRTTSVRSERNQPVSDAGFRLVARRFPKEMTAPLPAAARYCDGFDTSEGDDPLRGWIGVANHLGGASLIRSQAGSLSVRGGDLVLEGREGNFTAEYHAYHPVSVGDGAYRVRARVRMNWKRTKGGLGLQLLVSESFRGPTEPNLSLRIPVEGEILLFEDGERQWDIQDTPDLREAQDCELLVRGKSVEVRVWRAADPRPEAPKRTLMLEGGSFTPRFVGLTVSQLIGVAVFVDEILVEPLD